MNTLAFRKPISWLIVFSLILPGCSTTSVPTNQYKISAATVNLLEKDARFMRLVDLIRGAGKTIQLTDGLEFGLSESTQVAIPYDARGGERNLVQAEIRGGVVTVASLNRIVMGSDGRLTITTSDIISGVALSSVSSRDSTGKVTVQSYQVGTSASNKTLDGMLEVAQVQPQQSCTDQLQNYIVANSTMAVTGYAMLDACGYGLLLLFPPCWVAGGFFLAASLAAIFAGDQLRRCMNQGTLNIHQGVIV